MDDRPDLGDAALEIARAVDRFVQRVAAQLHDAERTLEEV